MCIFFVWGVGILILIDFGTMIKFCDNIGQKDKSDFSFHWKSGSNNIIAIRIKPDFSTIYNFFDFCQRKNQI